MRLFPGLKEKTLQIINPYIGLRIYLAFFFLLVGYYFLTWPIEALDTDLWYHLSGGRYFFTQGKIPHTSFFSFIAPTREYINYYWLFQVLVYKIFTWGDYYGLIILKTAVFAATILLIFFFLFRHEKEAKAHFYFAIVFTLYILLIPRFQLIRPHIFSYFFILLFLYFFEFHPSRLLFLPLIAVLWCNLHGIEYHVILLITLSYLIEFFIGLYRKKERLQAQHLRYIIPVLLTIAALYVTPHGSKLLGVPLTSIQFASEYINELRPIQISDLLLFHLSSSGLAWRTIANLISLLACIALVMSLWRKHVRISHLLLMAGGIFLLFKTARFVYEFALLSLPLIGSQPIIIPVIDDQQKVKKAWAIFVFLILLLPIIVIMNYFKNPPLYPFSANRLPEGVITFLNKIPGEGKVMNHPDWGGYLQWKLYPKYKIFMDMQVPFVFKDEDYYTASLSYDDAVVLSKVINRYEPTFIMAYTTENNIRESIKKFPQYKLVFFDHVAVLYMHEGHNPAIVREYEIKNLDPFTVLGKNIDTIVSKNKEEGFAEDLSKILKIYPECLLGNQLMALVHLKGNEWEKALFYATLITRNYPEVPTGYRLKGDALKGLGFYDAAIQNYHKALDRTGKMGEREIFKKIGYTYGAKQNHKKAYYFLKKGISIFSPETTSQELWDLSSAALLSDKFDDAYTLLQFTSWKVPTEDKEFHQRIQDRLARFSKPQ